MKNKVNYTQPINFINLFYTQQDKGNSKNKEQSRKNGIVILYNVFTK